MASNIDPKMIESLPSSLLHTIPAGAPPPGVTPNFVHPPSFVPAILGVGSAFLAPALLLYLVRMYTKLRITKKVYWDDFCCTLGFMFALVYYISVVIGCHFGGLGRHMWDLHLDKFVTRNALAEEYITTVVSAPALGLIKLTLFIQYYMLFWPLRWVRISVWAGGIVSGVFYLTVTLTGFILNSPRPGETLLEAVLSSRYATFAKFSIPIGVIGMLIDLYLIVLPIRAVATLQMQRSKKIGLMIIFLTGAFASIASIVGLYFRVRTLQDSTDESWIVGFLHIFSLIEMFAGISCACMPSVYKLLSANKLSTDSLRSTFKLSLLRSKIWSKGSQDETVSPPKTKVDPEEDLENHLKSPADLTPYWQMRVIDVASNNNTRHWSDHNKTSHSVSD